jgi:hypothetical protein
MKRYDDDVKYVIYRDGVGGSEYAIESADVIALDKHYSDMDKFHYAPDDLFVDGYLVTRNYKSGMFEYDFEYKTKLKIKTLIPTWSTVG